MEKQNNGGRGNDGRFQVGNPGGPGRPPRQTEFEYLLAISEACNLETFKEIVTATVEAARRGDDKARAWLSSYLVGNADAKAGRLSKIESAERQLLRDEEMERILGM
jgi:hypothetical protein